MKEEFEPWIVPSDSPLKYSVLEDDYASHWNDGEYEKYPLRSKSYIQDNKKCESLEPIFRTIGVNTITVRLYMYIYIYVLIYFIQLTG